MSRLHLPTSFVLLKVSICSWKFYFLSGKRESIRIFATENLKKNKIVNDKIHILLGIFWTKGIRHSALMSIRLNQKTVGKHTIQKPVGEYIFFLCIYVALTFKRKTSYWLRIRYIHCFILVNLVMKWHSIIL